MFLHFGAELMVAAICAKTCSGADRFSPKFDEFSTDRPRRGTGLCTALQHVFLIDQLLRKPKLARELAFVLPMYRCLTCQVQISSVCASTSIGHYEERWRGHGWSARAMGHP